MAVMDSANDKLGGKLLGQKVMDEIDSIFVPIPMFMVLHKVNWSLFGSLYSQSLFLARALGTW
jgi:hypothetical protein